MDWFLHDNGLRHERVKRRVVSTGNVFAFIDIIFGMKHVFLWFNSIYFLGRGTGEGSFIILKPR